MGSSTTQSAKSGTTSASARNPTTPLRARPAAPTSKAGQTPDHLVDLTGVSPSTSARKRKANEGANNPAGSAKKVKAEKAALEPEKRLRRFRDHAPEAFHKVYERALGQRFYVLNRTRGGTDECPEETVEMTGSTGNIYTVHIAQQPRCNCPHALQGNQCKHVLYVHAQIPPHIDILANTPQVLKRVLDAPFEMVYQLALLSSELRAIFAAAPPISGSGAAQKTESDKRKPVEGDCPICYCELDGGSEGVVWCRAACGQNIHEHCFKMWARTKQGDVTCPLCRSVWRDGEGALGKVRKEEGEMEEGYLNVADQVGVSRVRELTISCADSYPIKMGIEGAGIVAAVGSGVKTLKVGDEVYGFNMDKPIPRMPQAGFASQYAVAEERFLIHKPAHLSFEEAASFPGLVITALQTIRRGLQLRGEETLEGRTVYIPGALSGSGSLAVQVARNVFGAGKIISTASTAKMPLVEQYLPGMIDQLVDYQKEDVRAVVGRGTVDFALATQWATFDESVALLKPDSGTLVSIASVPTKETLRGLLGDRMPAWLGWLVGMAQLWYRWKLRGTAIRYEFMSGSPNVREDMEAAGEVIARGKIKAVMTVVELEDVDEVRRACGRVATGKGGLGKLVVRIAKE
ncbi:hypothetical protein AK830_g617 [Neonectria ditissima]|uniref:Uncharacterized protein n=1 Tax=Neonectria ditissima TaxID=78410 RepID=A0A0P7C1S7_9HYPO|nr:hypothetical protein AK830_g617 [Neonectria ditissima]